MVAWPKKIDWKSSRMYIRQIKKTVMNHKFLSDTMSVDAESKQHAILDSCQFNEGKEQTKTW